MQTKTQSASRSAMEGFTPRILVVGDPMLDQWVEVEVGGMSAEAPIPVFKQGKISQFPGGAENVARSLRSLGTEVVCAWVSREKIPIKTRYRTPDGKQMFRVDSHDFCYPLSEMEFWSIVDGNEPLDAVVVSDYAKGTIIPEIIDAIAELGLPTYIDTKRDPRLFERIETRTFFPNLKEFELHRESYVRQPMMVLKLGAEGAVIVRGDGIKIDECQSVN